MKIAIFGWGSLIWDPRDLPHYGPWKNGGPKLRIEFSRVSQDGRLTLVIDEQGPELPTQYVMSPRVDLEGAVVDLRKREGTASKFIGFFNALNGRCSKADFIDQLDIKSEAKKWCGEQDYSGCVWTALPPNFSNELNMKCTPENAVKYLSNLGEATRTNALRYIHNAPSEIQTPIRHAISQKWPIE